VGTSLGESFVIEDAANGVQAAKAATWRPSVWHTPTTRSG
jgi:beta-phosphoglucomutase-like phosphatase (HAD superfamily)